MKKESRFWGLFFIGAAIVLVLSKLGALGGISGFAVIATIFWVACVVKSVQYKNIAGGLFSVAFLCIIYDKQLGIEALTPWTVLGAALLGSIGAAILYHPKKCWSNGHFTTQETIETLEGSQFQFENSFAGSVKYINSDDFQSVNLRSSFGALKVYFDNAHIQNNEAIISVDVSFGAAELYIPKNWKVINGIQASFGGVEEKGKNQAGDTPVVRLVGKVSFGAVEVIYV